MKVKTRNWINQKQKIPKTNEYDFREELPPPDLPSTSGLSNPQKNVTECRDQLPMRRDNYAYFIITNGEPHDIGAKLL